MARQDMRWPCGVAATSAIRGFIECLHEEAVVIAGRDSERNFRRGQGIRWNEVIAELPL